MVGIIKQILISEKEFNDTVCKRLKKKHRVKWKTS